MLLPKLQATPSQFEPLTRIAGYSGVIYLKKSSLKSVYIGSKSAAVSIQGELFPKKSDLKKVIEVDTLRSSVRKNGGDYAVNIWEKDVLPGLSFGKSKKKVAPVETGAIQLVIDCDTEIKEQISGNLSTNENDLSTSLSTRRYYVNGSEVRKRIFSYINTSKGKKELYFWTVTFPAGTTENVAYRLYNTWLTRLRKHNMLKEYIWVCERQKNGTVHFHIAIPHRMWVHKANNMMAGTLKTAAKKGEIPFSVIQCRRYNGVDIAKNRKTKRITNFAVKKGARALASYLTKYLTKKTGTGEGEPEIETGFTHLAWHNSRGFSQCFTSLAFSAQQFAITKIHYFLNFGKLFENDWIVFVPWRDGPPPKLLDHLFMLNSYLQSLN